MNRHSFGLSSILLMCVALLVMGCRPGPVSVDTSADGKWNLVLWASSSCAPRGSSITARVTLTNIDSKPHRIELPDRPVLDLLISGQESGPSRWSEGRSLAEVSTLELAAGESKTLTLQWTVAPTADGVGARADFYRDPRMLDHPMTLILPITLDCPGLVGY